MIEYIINDELQEQGNSKRKKKKSSAGIHKCSKVENNVRNKSTRKVCYDEVSNILKMRHNYGLGGMT